MIEISQTRARKDEKEKIKGKKKSDHLGHTSKSFKSELKNNIAYNFEGTVDELMEDLKDQERRFMQNQTSAEMERYKALVQKILKMILEDGFREKTLKRTKKNWGDFTIVEKINTRLLEISEAITRSSKAFNLMKTIEEIRGLILDLLY